MIRTLWMGRYDDRDTIVIGTLWVEHCGSDGYSGVDAIIIVIGTLRHSGTL